jgi:hypothetical protein
MKKKSKQSPPYGYQLAADGKTLEENKKEQRVIKSIDGLRQCGWTYTEIRDECNRRLPKIARGSK